MATFQTSKMLNFHESFHDNVNNIVIASSNDSSRKTTVNSVMNLYTNKISFEFTFPLFNSNWVNICFNINWQMITPSNLIHDGDPKTINKFCTNDINNKEVSLAQGVAAEALATGILVFFACGCWDSRNAKNSDSVGLRFGLCITVLALAFIPHTGCSLNPARTFGPAIWNNYWENHWIYWVGPIGGSIIAALIYRCLFSPSTKNQENTMQDVGTLNGIET